ncbi:ABC transporter ATP-binding protein [Parenemella sanctibonifatiensis]|uniref:ABC transporter n=1 Tax=Parenemella sanctibonifatiensis TaxID=2016505 RepID=A0A255DXU3_9ACTN|nr:ABC transporter ATP-binding protein [Parenemella sanctibonifatiensis]OYN84117.1 ABC transporter [Parenemella sanctibonifatiensis]
MSTSTDDRTEVHTEQAPATTGVLGKLRDRRTRSQPTVADLEAWRGIAAEGNQEISERGSVVLKQRSRRLLGELIQPWLKYLWILVIAVLLSEAARLSVPLLVRRGIDVGVPPLMDNGNASEIITTVVIMTVALAIQAIGRVTFVRLSGRMAQEMLRTIRRRQYRHFQKLDVKFHDRYTSGRVISRMTNDIDSLSELLVSGIDGLITAALTLVGVGVILIYLDPRLGLICLVTFPFIVLLLRWFSRASTRTYRRVRELAALVIVQFVETMSGIKAVKAYRREPRNQQIFTDVAVKYADSNVDAMHNVAIFMPGIKLIGNLAIGAVLIIGGLFVADGTMTVGTLTAFLLYLRMFFEPMQEISQFYNTFQSASAALEKISGVLEEEPEVAEPTDPTPLPHAHGKVDFDHVHFAYVEDRPVLPDLDLHIPAGQTVALVGTTGAGKTTIAKLISRFYDPNEGDLRLDGVPLRELSEADLRRAVVMLTQENFMFDGSVGDNIAFGRPGASQADIEAAAKAVGAHEFISALPQGYDTSVEKRGSRLSAGQRQLVAFARVFLADPAVLILDEATSSLDVPSERLVQQALNTILADRTAVIIAHRLSTVEVADRVLVLEHGQILEDGSPAELIQDEGGRYAALHQAWVASLA